MRRFVRLATLMLLAVGLLLLPASPTAAARYQPGDWVPMSGTWEGTVTFKDVHFIGEPYNLWAPDMIVFEGMVRFESYTVLPFEDPVLPNGKLVPAGAGPLYWEAPIGRSGTATVGPFQSAMTLFTPQTLDFWGFMMSGTGQYKDLVTGPPTPGVSSMKLFEDTGVLPPPGQPGTFTYPSHGTIQIMLYF